MAAHQHLFFDFVTKTMLTQEAMLKMPLTWSGVLMAVIISFFKLEYPQDFKKHGWHMRSQI